MEVTMARSASDDFFSYLGEQAFGAIMIVGTVLLAFGGWLGYQVINVSPEANPKLFATQAFLPGMCIFGGMVFWIFAYVIERVDDLHVKTDRILVKLGEKPPGAI
jgi:hypothetical protein